MPRCHLFPSSVCYGCVRHGRGRRCQNGLGKSRSREPVWTWRLVGLVGIYGRVDGLYNHICWILNSRFGQYGVFMQSDHWVVGEMDIVLFKASDVVVVVKHSALDYLSSIVCVHIEENRYLAPNFGLGHQKWPVLCYIVHR